MNIGKFIVVVLVFSALSLTLVCAPKSGSSDIDGRTTELWEPMDSFVTDTWQKADWTNGSMFNCGFKPDHVTFAGGKMTLTLDNTASWGKSFSSGEYRTIETFGYGYFEANMQAARGNGIVSSFFLYTDSPWDEIDIEILGKDTTKVQFNYFVNGVGNREYIHPLGFDAKDGFHKYGIEWRDGSITWFVDSVKVYSVTTGTMPSHPMKIMMNLWPGTGVNGWLKPFVYSAPLYTIYDYVRYVP